MEAFLALPVDIRDLIMIAAKTTVILLLADILVGLMHAVVLDRFGNPNRGPEFLRQIYRNNQLHHAFPLLILRHGAWANASETIILGALIVVVAYLVDSLSFEVVLFAFFVSMSAVVHRWHHLPAHSVPRVVRWLQAAGVLQAHHYHASHHQRHHGHYSVMTGAANVIIDKSGVIEMIDFLAAKLFGLTPVDLKVVAERIRRDSGNDPVVALRWAEQPTRAAGGDQPPASNAATGI